MISRGLWGRGGFVLGVRLCDNPCHCLYEGDGPLACFILEIGGWIVLSVEAARCRMWLRREWRLVGRADAGTLEVLVV